MGKKVSFCIMIITLFISGCADKSPPFENVADVKMALIQAKQANALEYAPKELQLAKEQLKKVDLLIEEGKFVEAKFLAQKVAADVRLIEKQSLNKNLHDNIAILNRQIGLVKKEVINIKED